MIDCYLQYINDRKKKDIYREDKNILNESYIDLTTNDYLRLSKHPEMIKTACEFARKYGVGSGGSRLLLNNNQIFKDLEQKIAEWKETEAGLFFSTGYQLNSTVLPSLLCEKTLGIKPIVFGDKLNHASLNNGILLSGAKYLRYKNTDLDNLEWFLKKYQDNSAKFIVTESIFGMDGTLVDMEKLVNLSKKYKAFLYIDEAHASGIFGKNGSGISSGFSTEIDCIIGTFSKGMGCQGGYIATSQIIKDYLYNNCAGFVYSTAASPILAGLAAKSIDLASQMNDERAQLINDTEILKNHFLQLGYEVTGDKTHIFSIILCDPIKAIDFADKMLKKNILVSAVRYPSVPKETDRIRIALNTDITLENITHLYP